MRLGWARTDEMARRLMGWRVLAFRQTARKFAELSIYS